MAAEFVYTTLEKRSFDAEPVLRFYVRSKFDKEPKDATIVALFDGNGTRVESLTNSDGTITTVIERKNA